VKSITNSTLIRKLINIIIKETPEELINIISKTPANNFPVSNRTVCLVSDVGKTIQDGGYEDSEHSLIFIQFFSLFFE
jgi:hypothetical protein